MRWRWRLPGTRCQLVFTGGPNNARCRRALCWRNHVAVAQRDGGPQRPQTCPGRDAAKSLSHFQRLRYSATRPPVKEPLPLRSLPTNRLVCGTGPARSAPTGTSQKWSEDQRSARGWRAACWASKLTEITKVASTGKGTAAPGFNGGLRGQFFRQKWNSRSIFRPI